MYDANIAHRTVRSSALHPPRPGHGRRRRSCRDWGPRATPLASAHRARRRRV